MANIAFNSNTIKPARLQDKIKATSNAGYDAIGLRYDDVQKFLHEGHNLKDVVSILKESHLSVNEMAFGPGWQYTTGTTKKQTLNKAEETCKYSKALGCKYVVACASAERGNVKQAIEDYEQLCRIGNNYGVQLPLEFLGFADQIKDLKTAWEIVQRADVSNGGLLLDTFHFYRGGSDIEELHRIPMEDILLVHLADAPKMALNELKDTHRVFPGKGIIPLNRIVRILMERGYRGFFSVELFNQSYWKDDPNKVAQMGLKTSKRILDKLET